mgnify:CR=1 FL=1
MREKKLLSLVLGAGLAAFFSLFGADTTRADTASQSTAPASQGEVLLTVSLEGEGAREYQMTLDQLQALAADSFETATIWTTGPQSFTGVPLADLLAQFDMTAATSGVTLEARAVNDYMVEIPLSDAAVDGPIIAYLRNGKTMSLRGKGPLWLVYPYDSNPAYRTEAVYSRSIWQLDRLILRPTAE